VKKWTERSRREQAIVNVIATAITPVVWLFGAFAAIMLVGAALWWIYIISALAWEAVKAMASQF
jgi:hypothetical protein